jgi:hypothetical protein
MIGPPPPHSILIFGGSAGIDERNLRALLDNWLPEDLVLRLPPPVLQKTIPARGYAGLRLVEAYLGEQFGKRIERPDDLQQYIRDMENPQDAIFAVLWGEEEGGGDDDTYALLETASRRGIPIYDLAEGLDQLAVTDEEEPGETPQPLLPATRGRPRAPVTTTPPAPAAAPAGAPAAAAQAAPVQQLIPDIRDQLLGMLVAACQDAAAALAAALAMCASAGQQPGPAQPQQDSRAVKRDREPAGETPAPRTTAASPAARSSRTYLRNPQLPEDDPAAYRPRGRGRLSPELRDWETVTLTPEQQDALGLGR